MCVFQQVTNFWLPVMWLIYLVYVIVFHTFQFSQVNIDEPMFQPFPSEIFFQNFEPFEIYEVPLVLRNNDKVSLLFTVWNTYKVMIIVAFPQK